jgi:hypothetical protein
MALPIEQCHSLNSSLQTTILVRPISTAVLQSGPVRNPHSSSVHPVKTPLQSKTHPGACIRPILTSRLYEDCVQFVAIDSEIIKGFNIPNLRPPDHKPQTNDGLIE